MAKQLSQHEKHLISNSATFWQGIDQILTDEDNRYAFSGVLSDSFGKEIKIEAYADDEKAELAKSGAYKKYAYANTTVSSVADTISTSAIPVIEQLVLGSDLLNEVTIETLAPGQIHTMYESGVRFTGQDVAEGAAPTEQVLVTRKGDGLQPNMRKQVSMIITGEAMHSITAADLAREIATQMIPGLRHYISLSVLYAGSAAANGTAKNNVRGIKNNFGVNGTGDSTGTIGAISYATKAATDTYITSLGGRASTDAYDLCLLAHDYLVPNEVSPVSEEQYRFVMNRRTWATISTVNDGNGRPKSQSAIDPVTNKPIRQINGTPVIIDSGVETNEVIYAPLRWYILKVSSDGLLDVEVDKNINTDVTTYAAKAYIDGSMKWGQKYQKTTAVTIGSTAPNNHEYNAWRTFKIV